MIAVIVEAIIDYFDFIFAFIENERIRKVVKQSTALVIAILFTFKLHGTLLAMLTEPLGVSVDATFDMIVSGIFCSRGANYLSDIVRLIVTVGTKAKADISDDDFWDMFDFEEGEEDEPVEKDFTNYIL